MTEYREYIFEATAERETLISVEAESFAQAAREAKVAVEDNMSDERLYASDFEVSVSPVDDVEEFEHEELGAFFDALMDIVGDARSDVEAGELSEADAWDVVGDVGRMTEWLERQLTYGPGDDVLEYVLEGLSYSPEVDAETRAEVGKTLAGHEGVYDFEALDWALESAGVPREDKMAILDETCRAFDIER